MSWSDGNRYCMHVKTIIKNHHLPHFEFGKVYAVLRREFTDQGVFYHLCDNLGRHIGQLHESECEILEH
jgi:hypothetical protein